jgi:hypothetical protein
MALKIICVTGTGNTGKTRIIREFTARHLKYTRAKGDVLGIFPMPQLGYAVGVTGSGDTSEEISRCLEFLNRYDGLRVIIVASHKRGKTIQVVESFARRNRTPLHLVRTKRVAEREIDTAISTKVSEIRRLMPRRGR